MTKQSKGTPTSALGQFYGYGLQEARFLHHLLRSNRGDTIALECIDDVSGVKGAQAFAEQDKSGLAHNPISDSAVDLWKTLANWLDGRRKGYIPSGTRYILFVAQPYRGKIAEKMSACRTAPEAKALLSEVREKFWGEGPAYPKKAKIPEKLAKHLNTVLSAKDSAISEILKSFRLECGSGSPYNDIAAEIASAPVDANPRFLLWSFSTSPAKFISLGG